MKRQKQANAPCARDQLPSRLLAVILQFGSERDVAASQLVCTQWRLPPSIMGGVLCDFGTRHEAHENWTKARALWQAAIDRGNVHAMYKLGSDLIRSLPADEETRGFHLLGLAAEQGSVSALFDLGNAYEVGWSVPQSMDMAQTMFQRAADLGHVEATAMLGHLLIKNNGNVETALKHFTLAAEAGNAFGQAQLGHCYLYGNGVARDLVKAKVLLEKSAAQNNKAGKVHLGYLLLWDRGPEVNMDTKRAEKLLKEASARGSSSAACELGYAYLYGTGHIHVDLLLAFCHFQRAWVGGQNIHAACELGLMYMYCELGEQQVSVETCQSNCNCFAGCCRDQGKRDQGSRIVQNRCRQGPYVQPV